MNPEKSPYRKTPAHFGPVENDNRTIIVFLTICTRNRRPILARPEVHALLQEIWSRASHWLVGRYVIMPDHIHLFCSPGDLIAHPLPLWIAYWRNLTTRDWPRAEEKPIWQKDYWDRQLRNRDSYQQKWDYVKENPVRHKLEIRSEDWPYQGELNAFRWHEP